jgi:RHS repeat-associated protein
VNGAGAIAMQYDHDGLVTQAGAAIIERNGPAGTVSKVTVGNIQETRTYDGTFGELQAITVVNTQGTPSTSDDTPIATFAYPQRDKVGRIQQRTESIGGGATTTFDYGYDDAGRLHNVAVNGTPGALPTPAYMYDDNGNRTKAPGVSAASITYDDQDRLLTYGSASYEYTRNGELKRKTVGSAITDYEYDALGNLRTVTLPSGTMFEYVVDAASRLVGKRVNGSAALDEVWIYDGLLRTVAQLDDAGSVVARFVYGSRTHVPDYVLKSGGTYRLVTDHLGSVRVVADVTNGAVVQRLDYDEFGRVTQDTNPGFQPFGFAGGVYDVATELVRFGARDYDSETGRWLKRDPIRFAGNDSNLYAYVFNDPINLFDASGLWVFCTRIEISQRFICYSFDGGLDKPDLYDIHNPPCFFNCKFSDEEFELGRLRGELEKKREKMRDPNQCS